MKEYYTFGTSLDRNTPNAIGINLNKKIASKLLMGDFSNIDFPIQFKQLKLNKTLDIIDTGYPSLFLISNKLCLTLTQSKLLGWKTFSINIKTNRNVKYSGLAILGKANIDYSNSISFKKQLVKGGPDTEYIRGFEIKNPIPENYDFFRLNNGPGIIISNKAYQAISSAGTKNLKLVNVKEKAILAMIIERFIKK